MSNPPNIYKTPATFFVFFVAMSALLWWTFYERYVKYEDCISQLTNSSCLTPDGGNLTSGGLFWGMFAFLAACIALLFVCVLVFRFTREKWRGRKAAN